MRIAMMTNNYKPFIGGVPISIERLSKELREMGHEVYIFAPEYDHMNEQEDEENGVIRYKSWKGKMDNGAVIPNILDSRIQKEFERREFDLIHVHHPLLIGNIAVYYGKKYGIPVVFTYHTKYEEYLHYLDTISGFKNKKLIDTICHYGNKIVPWYMKWFLKGCSGVIAPSMDICRYVQSLDVDMPIQILPTGLPADAYEKDEKRASELRDKLLGGKKHLLCTLSRLEKEKNQYFLIDAVKELTEKTGDDFRFVFVGDGNERKSLEAYSEEMGLKDIILFIGSVPNHEVKHYLSASDVFLFSSKSETQGIVILEAMASELPVVALDASGVRDLVKDGENGFLIRENENSVNSEEKEGECQVKVSTAGYVEKTIEMLYDDSRRMAFGRKARETALYYQNSNIGQMAEDFYKTTIENCMRRERWKKSGITSLWLRMIKKLDKVLKYI